MDVENCRQLIEQLLSSYVDGELDRHTSQSLELHLQMCPPCASFLRTFTATKQCARSVALAAMPEDCEASLWSFLKRECGDHVAGPSGPSGCPSHDGLHEAPERATAESRPPKA